MSSTSLIENSASSLDWLEGASIVMKRNLTIFPADLKTPENLFNCLNDKSLKRSIDYTLFGFSLELFLEFRKAANAEDSFGQFFLGCCYNHGIGTLQDGEKEFELYSKVAEAGNINAQHSLALCYQHGWGATKHSEEAFELYSKAAEAGNTIAQYALELCYQNGRGTTKNEEKAFELYSKEQKRDLLSHKSDLEDIIQMDCKHTQINIEISYRNGWGIAKSLEDPFEFYLKVAEVGNQIAQNNLRWYYQNGWGTTKNFEKVFEIYSKAAETNYSSYRTFEAFFDQLSDEFKCLKCGNLDIAIRGSPICPFCDTNESANIFKAGLPKFSECYSTLKDPIWCKSCEYSRFSRVGTHGIVKMVILMSIYIIHRKSLKAAEAA
ncbi:hypothetical protein G9A89_023470 [Geosiphon pyriformis]|nr:hypothetical protein G9A89_023470 [Geosiphon pyriformis]